MENAIRSHVLTIRIPSVLLDAVRKQARQEGRSISREVVSIVSEKLGEPGIRTAKPRKISGWLAHLEVPETHAAFRLGRAAASAAFKRRLNARSKRNASN